ncbi:phage major tail tube protein [Pseudovibrio sp. Tun.PSC04-5.I4]|uniref:phage major tail tube protein n=1 Tax=Pseudovibrio sp. Tun.PSC04-5.I4 TaxID=1798213 RepID=UPI000881D82D|nr:phage major tail tube protein [Pseudovibrio sp. Tun.PSC04-5.I4]SDR07448.1 Phage tail tube protein FII [Pseudovibrio sp. Tun.PSC04-5.I4]
MEQGHKLDGFTLWMGNNDYGGIVTGITRPELSRNLQERKTGGRRFPVGTSHGYEVLKMTIKTKGLSLSMYDLLLPGSIDGVKLFVRGHFDDEMGNTLTSVEEVRGRVKSPKVIDEMKADDDVEGDIEIWPVFYSWEMGGAEKLYIDVLNDIIRPDIIDGSQARRASLGRT